MQPRREVSSHSRVLNSELRKIPVAAGQQKIPSHWCTAIRHKQRLWEVHPDKRLTSCRKYAYVCMLCPQESMWEICICLHAMPTGVNVGNQHLAKSPYQEQIQCVSCSQLLTQSWARQITEKQKQHQKYAVIVGERSSSHWSISYLDR